MRVFDALNDQRFFCHVASHNQRLFFTDCLSRHTHFTREGSKAGYSLQSVRGTPRSPPSIGLYGALAACLDPISLVLELERVSASNSELIGLKF